MNPVHSFEALYYGLQVDPGEMRNMALDPGYNHILEGCRDVFWGFFKE